MIVLKLLLKSNPITDSHEQWIHTPNRGNYAHIDIGEFRKVHRQKSHILDSEIAHTVCYEPQQVSML